MISRFRKGSFRKGLIQEHRVTLGLTAFRSFSPALGGNTEKKAVIAATKEIQGSSPLTLVAGMILLDP